MKFALIGTGFIMPRHAEAIYALGGKIRSVINTSHGEEAWREAIKKTDAEYTIILGPNDLHYPIAMAAADAGKIVLSEKPLAIKSEHVRELAKRPNIFTVLQLHHHPFVKQLKQEVSPDKQYKIEMDISVHRDKHYYESWKGELARSGGVLMNLGVHYFDVLIHLFGKPNKAILTSLDDKTGVGIIEGKNYLCNFKVSTGEERHAQRRVFKINDVDYNFSSKDNLSYENLHTNVYQDLVHGQGATPAMALPSIELIEELYKTKGVFV
jgi:UDP-N-acetyl-2-amino-2-deoxyglucuronate dehydrogenase